MFWELQATRAFSSLVDYVGLLVLLLADGLLRQIYSYIYSIRPPTGTLMCRMQGNEEYIEIMHGSKASFMHTTK